MNNKNIFLYYLYSALYGLYPINAIVSLFFISRGLGFAEIGIVVAVFQITGILFEIPTGFIADKFGRRISIILGLTLLIFTSSLWTLAHTYVHFSFLAVIWMLGFACISGSFEAYIYDYLKDNQLLNHYDNVISRATSISFFFGAFGSIVGAWLFSIKGEYPYYAQIATFTASLLVILLMTQDQVQAEGTGKKKIHIFSGFTKIRKSPQLIWLSIFISGFYAFYMYFLNSLNSPYLLSLKVFDIKYLGLFFALMSMYQAFLSDRFSKIKDRLTDTQMIYLLMCVQVIALCGLSYLFGYLGIISYILFISIEPFEALLINSFAQKYADSPTRATTISTIKMVSALFAASVGILAGSLFDKINFKFGFLIIAVSIFIFSMIMLVIKRVKNISLQLLTTQLNDSDKY